MNKKIYRKFIFYLCIIIVFGIISSVISLIVPKLIGDTIDYVIKENENSYIIENVIKIFTFYALVFVLDALSSILVVKASNKFIKTIRDELFFKLQNLSINYIDKNSNGEIISYFTVDAENILIAIMQGVPKIINGACIILGSIIIMLGINFTMGIITIFSAPIMYFLSKFVTNKTNHMFKNRADIVSYLNGIVQEGVTSKKTITDFNYQSTSFNKFKNVNENLYKVGRKAQFYSSLTNPFTRFAYNITYIIVGITGVILCSLGKITVGTISSFFIYANLFARPSQEITSIITEIQIAIASAKRIREFLRKEEEKYIIKNSDIKIQGSIEFKNVSFSYEKGKKFIENMNLKVRKGEKVAIVGKTGSGKTTIANLIMRFYHINSGEILIDGENIENIPSDVLRKNIGIVLQDTRLFTGTVKDNISYGNKRASEEEIKNAAKLAGADEFIMKLPNGYDTVLNNESTLSEGELQLLTIARVILTKPPILILDEATSNVDIITENKVQKAFSSLMKDATTFIIAHRLSTTKSADRIIVIENGNIVEAGNYEELMEKRGKYFELYSS